MPTLRNYIPKRRNITTVVKQYRDHKEDLKLDYQNRCGYCNDMDTWRNTWYEIDHFVPDKYWVTIKSTDYSNLVYACRSCNNAKRRHWPTKDEKIHNHNDEGFIDPCDDKYDSQFSRLENGRIVPETKLGQWMYNTLKLYKPQHEIICNIEQLDNLIIECKKILAVMPENESNNKTKDLLLNLFDQYWNYTKQLGSI